MTKILRNLAVLLAVATLGACAQKGVIVLMPDDDGTVGRAVVTNQGGSVVLDEAREATELTTASAAPKAPKVLGADAVDKDFKDALAALPVKPYSFVLYFVTGSTDLTADSRKRLPEILATVERWVLPDVAVVGHSDRSGSSKWNYTLSLRRAQRVRDLIVDIGVPPDFIEVTSHGENNPVVPTADGVAEPRNRRVEVTVR